jgi:hypothetical protein
MVRINDEGGFVPAAGWADVRASNGTHRARRAGASSSSASMRGPREVEVAHEALFRVWLLLAGWLEEERESDRPEPAERALA